jgi:hypothetical protein
MYALREIYEVKNHRVVIDLPQQFQPQKVEIIIVPIDGAAQEAELSYAEGQRVNYDQYFGVTNIGVENIEHGLASIRGEWDRYVFD